MNKAGTILEVIWFVLGGLLLFMGVNETLDKGIDKSWHFLVFALLALVMYYRRRRIRLSSRKNG